jgi:hypothetical protein
MLALRSVLAVIGGYLTMAVLVAVLTGIAIKMTGRDSSRPTPGYLAANVFYSLLAAFAGGFVAAKIAGRYPVQHGVALAVVMFAMAIVSYFQYRNTQPLWYQFLLTAMLPGCAIAGAALVKV